MANGTIKVALKSEVLNDPQALGLTALFNSKSLQACADLLNLKSGNGAANIFLPVVASSDVVAAIDPTEFDSAAMTATHLSQLTVVLSGGTVNSGSAGVRSILNNIFAPALSFPLTRANILALVRRTGSRAEVLFGANTVIDFYDLYYL